MNKCKYRSEKQSVKENVKTQLSDFLNVQDEDFRMAAAYLLRKNEELYRRLS